MATPEDINFDDYFKNAIDSLKNQQIEFEELLIVHTKEESLIELLNNYDFGNLTVTKLLWDKDPNYADQVNYGIKNAKGKWVSLFEFDDEYANIWFKNVAKYTEAYPEVQMFLPVVVEVDEKGVFAGLLTKRLLRQTFHRKWVFLQMTYYKITKIFKLLDVFSRKTLSKILEVSSLLLN